MDIFITKIGDRKFLHMGDVVSIPVDRIKEFVLDAANGGCSNAVKIVTDDPEDDCIFAYENADALRAFLKRNKL